MTASVTPLRSAKTTPPAPVWLSPEQVCERIPGMTVDILCDQRKKRVGPPFYKPSQKTVIYEQSEIDEWVRNSSVAVRHP